MAVLRNPDILEGKIRYERQNFAIAELLLQKDTAVSAGDTVVIKGRYTVGGSTEVGTADINGVTVNGTKQFTSSGVTFQTDGIAQYDIIYIKEGEFRGTYIIDSVDSETQLTLIASANFTTETNLDYEIWTANIFSGTVDEQDFSKTKLILCKSEADEQDALIPSATYYGRDGGLIQDLLDSGDLAFINHTFTQTADYMYRAPHNWFDIALDGQPDTDYWDDIGEVGAAYVKLVPNVGNVDKACALYYGGDNNQVRLRTTNMQISASSGTIIDFHIRLGSTTQQGEMTGEDDDNNLFYLRVNADGKFVIPGVATLSYSADTWYHIRFTLADSTYRVDVNDANYGGNINYLEGGGTMNFEISSHSQLGVTPKVTYCTAIGCTTDNNYTGDINLLKQYHELTYSGNYTEFAKWRMRGDKTYKQYFDDYIESIYGTWYYLPSYEIVFNDGDIDSGVDIDITTPETWGIIGKLQVKAYDKVILLGGYSGSSRLIATSGAGNIIYKDTYAQIQKQEVLDALAAQILTREGNNPKTCELYMRYFDKGYIQIGEEVTIKANTIKFLNSGDFVETEDTQYKIRKEIYHLSNGIHTYTYYELDDVLIFLSSEDREVTREDQENAVLVDQVAGGESEGEANTAQNVGTDGVGVFDGKVGSVLQFRNIAPETNQISITLNGNDIDIDVIEANIALDDIGVPDALVNMNDQDLDNVGSILFDINDGAASEEGRLKWNSTDGTLEVGMPGGNVNLQIGQEELIRVRNITGVTIVNGAAVRISGVSGNNPTIGLSDANDPANAGCIGLATEDIAHNDYGYVTTSGMVRDIDTSAWNVADRLFVSQTAGELTNVYPSGTDRIILAGIVIKDDPTEGMVWVLPINQAHLSELSSVTISSPADNELLTYDIGTGTWINQTAAEVGIATESYVDLKELSGFIDPSSNIGMNTYHFTGLGDGTDAQDSATMANIDAKILTHKNIATAHQDAPALIATHATDADAHLDRYTKAEVNAFKLNKWVAPDTNIDMDGFHFVNLAAGTAAGDSMRYDEFNTHKTSADHDGRYMTDAEIAALVNNDVYSGPGWLNQTDAASRGAIRNKIELMITDIGNNTTQAEVEAIIDTEINPGQSINNAIDALILSHKNGADEHHVAFVSADADLLYGDIAFEHAESHPLHDHTVPTSNIDMEGKRFVDMDDGVAGTDSMTLQQKFTAANARSAINNIIGSDGHLDGTLDFDTNSITDITQISMTGVATYDKLRVWTSNLYTIGMNSAMTYGGLNDYAMTFTMNNESDRGFIWRDYDDAKSDGAMSLTTTGVLQLKTSIRLGTGATITTLGDTAALAASDVKIPTNTTVKEYIDGRKLSDFLDPTSNISMNTAYHFVNLAVGAAAGDSVNFGQVEDAIGHEHQHNISVALLEDTVMYGSANAAWIPLIFEHPSNQDSVNSGGVGVRNQGSLGTAGNYVLPIPTNKGGLKLYITGIRFRIYDADATDYLDLIRIFGRDATYNTEYTDNGNYTTADLHSDTFVAKDMSAYDDISVYFNWIFATQYEYDQMHVGLQCYYYP